MKFYNVSNHPSGGWGAEQLEAARAYGDVEDIAFPRVAFGDDVARMADAIAARVEEGSACMVQGEMRLTHALANRLKAKGCIVLAAFSERESAERIMPDGSVRKESSFRFKGFEEYVD